MAALVRLFRDRRVFVDSSAYLALLDLDDRHHGEAVELVTSLAEQGYRQFTSNILLIETHALILSSLGIAQALQFLREMSESRTIIVRVRARDEERGQQILFQYTDKDFSFADAISFGVMERLRIRYAFSFDRHFAQYGFTALTPSQL